MITRTASVAALMLAIATAHAEYFWVFKNRSDQQEEDFLRVLVIGVEASQSIRNFEWGPGPLTRRERRNRV
jgi:hypothetical protein